LGRTIAEGETISMKNIFYYSTDIGRVGIADNGEAITNLYFDGEKIPQDTNIKETELIRKAAVQFQEYLAGKRKVFDIPLAMEGTPFQQTVWNALTAIPYGETRSYREVAESIGRPKACRAVGMANNKNPIAVFVPCHRVIGTNGKLVGYAGGLDLKAKLLDMEKQYANG
jgi:methylated-DNA-[protein]-cysteine S-methyltransferase